MINYAHTCAYGGICAIGKLIMIIANAFATSQLCRVSGVSEQYIALHATLTRERFPGVLQGFHVLSFEPLLQRDAVFVRVYVRTITTATRWRCCLSSGSDDERRC